MNKMFQDKKCFIVTPIGSDKTDIRRSADGVITSVIKPLLEDIYGFVDIKAAHDINASGSINNQIMNRLLDDDLVIANLTGVNPNVMYELAVRHATMKAIIHIAEEGTKLPFDIVDQRTIFYKNDMLGVKELTHNLKNSIEEVMRTKEHTDNPIYNAAKTKIYRDTIISDPQKGVERFLLDRFDILEAKLSSILPESKITTSHFAYLEDFTMILKTPNDYRSTILSQYLEKQLSGAKKTLCSFKVLKEELSLNHKEVHLEVTIGSNLFLPYTDELKDMINRYKGIEVLELLGNDIPF